MEPVAFLSYAHLDDASAMKELSFFHDSLESELRIQTGLQVHIFFDKKSIGWGKRWASFIDQSLEHAAFLVPILTPAFFQSRPCREEYERFVKSEKSIGRKDLILPIYYVKCREIEKVNKNDTIATDIATRQYRDWRHLRLKPRDSMEVISQFSELASIMAETFFELQDASKLSPNKKSEEIARGVQASNYMDSLLDRDIDYDSIVAYSVEMYPHLPVSREWTNELLEDIDRTRYRKIRDLDREVKFARAKVSDYAKSHRQLFKSSTDYLTKTLIFVDSAFRQSHDVSLETLQAAEEAGITRY